MTPRVSIALLTRGRPESLRRALASVRAQSAQPWEILVSDDSEEASTAEAGQAIAAEHGSRWQAGPRRGLYANRNAAARACRGTHVRSMDDDHVLPPGHLALCLDAAARDPRALWTTGENSIAAEGAEPGFTEWASQLGPTGLGEWPPPDRLDDNWAVSDGSTVFPREVFDLPRGGFVEAWPYGQSYLELGAWLYARGWKSRCVRGAAVDHHAGPATFTRLRDGSEVRSRLFAAICWHFHFRRTPARGWLRLLAILRGKRGLLGHLRALPGLRRLARERWEGGG